MINIAGVSGWFVWVSGYRKVYD